MVSDTSMPAAISDPVPNGHPNGQFTSLSVSSNDSSASHSPTLQKSANATNSALDKEVKHSNGSNGYIEEDIDDDVVVRLVNTAAKVSNGETGSNGDCEDASNVDVANGACAKENEEKKEKMIEKILDCVDDESKGDQEYFFIQDTGFTIKIAVPGLDTFEIQVSAMELVQEIHQLLMDREDTCHRTCFSLQLDSTTLDNFAELKNIEGLKEGSLIKLVEEPYTIREARIHVRQVRDLIKSIDPAASYNGMDCNSLTFLNIITQGDVLEKKKTRPDSVDCTPPDFIIPNCKDRSLIPLQPQAKEQKASQALKVLTSSGWNPPPGTRKLHGDLMYLYVVTLEDKHYHVTASTRGFYLNQSTEDDFNPKPATPKVVYHSLIELLNQVSPIFKRNFSIIQKKRTQKHPFERVATPYQVYSWTAPNFEHSVDSIRAEDAFSSKLGYEEHIPGQTRDWNEELQTTRELPRKSLPERLLRERAVFKVHSDFVAAATRGAMAVIDGNVMAINPGEETKMQMFIWNNIFFSLGFDVRDHYKELGGDAAAYTAPCNDLQGVRAYSSVDVESLYTLGTVVVDYRGYRITAQSIIPGILEREQEQSVVYGSVDFGKSVLTNPKYMELLNKAGHHLKILPHKVLNEKNEEVELCSSVECKGIIGNDSRHYILDLLRTFPPDMNYLAIEGEELSKEAKAMGYPRQHKHKLCCLRQELIDAFVEAKYLLFIKLAAFHLQQLGLKNLSRDNEKNRSSTNGTSKSDKSGKNEIEDSTEKTAFCESEKTASCESEKTTICETDKPTIGETEKPTVLESEKPTISESEESKLSCQISASVLNCHEETAKDNKCHISELEQPESLPDVETQELGNIASDSSDSLTKSLEKLVVTKFNEPDDLEKLLVAKLAIVDKTKELRAGIEAAELECDEVKQSTGCSDVILASPGKPKDNKETNEYKKIVESYTNGEKFEDSTKDVIRKAAQAVGSLKDTEFDIRFNPDVYSTGVSHPNSDGEHLKKQRQLVKDAADFLLTVQIPGLIRDCLEHSASPIDGVTLTEALHSRGINIRYLGKIAEMLAKVPQLQYVYSLTVGELICRAAKHVFTLYLQGLESVCLASSISHFLNCFLSSALALSTPAGSEEMQIKPSKRKGKKKGKQNPFASPDNEWASLTQRGLWKELKSELESYYGWNIVTEALDTVVEHYGLQKVALMRSFSLKVGLQLLLKDYNFDHRNRATFNDDDILNIFPIVKHINPRATDAYNFYSTGQLKIQQGYLKEGYDMISEAFNLLNNVYGAMHPEIAQCLRMLARLNYLMGDHTEALAFQQKAVLMSERVNGIDHPYTITEYTHLALYCFANSQISTSLKLLYRARYLALLICGENHPEVAVLDSNIGLILHAVGEYDLSLRFLQHALKLNIKYYGCKSLKVAVNYHLVARTQSCMGDFRGALQNEKETYAIYKLQLGEEHDKTKESSECLRHLTQQAVVLQKTMNEIYKGTAGASLPPIQIQAPSMSSVLDMLNIINGILFVQISQQDIENIKGEMERRQQRESAEKENKEEDVATSPTDSKEGDVAIETVVAAKATVQNGR